MSANTLAKLIGLAAGAAVAVVLVMTWRVPATSGTLGADVKLVATPPGELVLRPGGAFLQGRGLSAGGPAASGRLGLRNITGRRLAVRVRLLPSSPDLDRALRVELTGSGRDLVAGGRLHALRRWSRRTIEIEPGKSRTLEARTSVMRGARDYEGRIVDVTLELRARPVGR